VNFEQMADGTEPSLGFALRGFDNIAALTL